MAYRDHHGEDTDVENVRPLVAHRIGGSRDGKPAAGKDQPAATS
jgi:hypothetical protein